MFRHSREGTYGLPAESPKKKTNGSGMVTATLQWLTANQGYVSFICVDCEGRLNLS